MTATSRGARDQLVDVPSAAQVHADKNLIFEGEGPFSWDATSGELVIGGSAYLRDHRSSTVQDLAGTYTGLSTAGDVATVALDRETPATAAVLSNASAGLNFADTTDAAVGGSRPTGGEGLYVLGVRGADNRFYLRNGDVLEDGATNQYAGWSSAPERARHTASVTTGIADYTTILAASATAADGVADGSATSFSTGFTYPVGQNRLMVYRNGLLLTPDYEGGDFNSGDIGTFPGFEDVGARGDYHEVNAGSGLGTAIQFYDGFEPSSGDTIICVLLK